MHDTNPTSRKDLTLLRQRLSHVTRSWALDDYKAFVVFYTRILPKLMRAERCTIFIMDPDSNRICSMFGTGLQEISIEPPMEGSIAGKAISTGKSVIDNDLTSHHGFHVNAAEQTGFVCYNMLCSPIKGVDSHKVSGAVQVLNKRDNRPFSTDDQLLLEEAAHFLSISIESIVLNQEIIRIAGYLEQEVDRLEQNSVRGQKVIAESPAMQEVLNLVKVVSSTPINVMILGENGTGKDIIARMIHEHGQRSDGPYVPVNCACIPESLVESEFFGHEKGAFTGADTTRIGRFEESSGGTLFLDEVAEMPLTVQPKFLRALEEHEGSRLGSSKTIAYDLRLICATNKDIADEVKNGTFREDLYFRLFSVEILIPPLRERPEDILPLSLHFLEQTNNRFGKQVAGYSPELIELFEQYQWPGNVRQLLREVERLVALTPDHTIIPITKCSPGLQQHLNRTPEKTSVLTTLSIPDQVQKLEKDLIRRALKKTSGNKSQAAKLLKLTRQGLAQKLKRYEMTV